MKYRNIPPQAITIALQVLAGVVPPEESKAFDNEKDFTANTMPIYPPKPSKGGR